MVWAQKAATASSFVLALGYNVGYLAIQLGFLSSFVLDLCNRAAVYCEFFFHFASGRGAKYCDEYVCLSVCLSVCLLA